MSDLLTAEEALSLAEKLDVWPAGMGFVLEKTDLPRYQKRDGWRCLPDWKPFSPPPPQSETVCYCPVVQLHEARRTAEEKNYYGGHLDAFWAIAQAVATVTSLSLEDARHHYNGLLKADPPALAGLLRVYASTS